MRQKILLEVRADFCNQYNIFRMDVLYIIAEISKICSIHEEEKDFERKLVYLNYSPHSPQTKVFFLLRTHKTRVVSS